MDGGTSHNAMERVCEGLARSRVLEQERAETVEWNTHDEYINLRTDC